MKPKQANIIVLLTDDQGYAPLGAHGHPFLQTPHLDAFHRDSVRLTDFHSGSTCAPTRAGLLTGHWCNSTGVWHTIGGRSLLRKNEYSLANALKEHGYITGLFGKWHLGDEHPYRPMDRGFDRAIYHGGGGVGQQPDWWGNDYFDDVYLNNGSPTQYQGYCTEVFFREAINFIGEQAERGMPFFCYLATNAPHHPFNVEQKYREMYAGDTETDKYARFCGMVSNIDDQFGVLRQKLKEWNIEDDTILIFMSDNGQALIPECEGNEQYNAGLRGFKASEYDGGHKIPFFIRYPNGNIGREIGGGRDIPVLASYVDVMPTLLDLAGGLAVKLPADHPGFHGNSLKPILMDPGADGSATTSSSSSRAKALLSACPPIKCWKDRIVVTDTQRIPYPVKWRMCSVMQNKWRLVNGVELYNVENDPGQEHNIIDQHPELVEILRNGYEDWWITCRLNQADDETPISIGATQQEVAVLRTHDMRNETGDTVWNQAMVRQGIECLGWWEVLVEQSGVYQFELSRWPHEAGHKIREGITGTDIDYRAEDVDQSYLANYSGGKALDVCTACLIISGVQRMTRRVNETEKGAVFELSLEKGNCQIRAFFSSDFGGQPLDNGEAYFSAPYYVYVKRINSGTENSTRWTLLGLGYL